MLVIPVILLSGLFLGWGASLVLRTSYYHGVVLNLVVGVVSAALWGHFFAPVFGRPSLLSGIFSLGTIAISMVGTIITLLIVGLVIRAGAR